MKKLLSILSLAAMLVAVSGCYDDSALKTKVDELDQRITSLESLNSQVQSLKTIVEGLQKNITITSVTPITGGYKIVFSDKTEATIVNGQDGQPGQPGAQGPAGKDGQDGAAGQDGHSPVISVKEDGGIYYWAVDGEYLLDADGKKVPVSGATPTLKIDNGEWYVSYDGEAWSKVPVSGAAVSGGIFKKVEIKGTSVVFTLNDETTFEVPLTGEFTLTLEENVVCQLGKTTDVPYVITGAENPTIYCVPVGDFSASIEKTDALTGNIVITTPATGEPKGQILVFATDGKTTLVKCIAPWCGIMQVSEAFTFAKEAGVYEIPVKTNITGYKWTTETTWISIPETKSDLRDEVIKIQLEANTTTDVRTGSINIVSENGSLIQAVTVIQNGKPKNFYSTLSGGTIDPSTTIATYKASEVSTDASWITIDPTTKVLTVAANTGIGRVASVKFGAASLNVIQNPGNAFLDVNFDKAEVGDLPMKLADKIVNVGNTPDAPANFYVYNTTNTTSYPFAKPASIKNEEILGHKVVSFNNTQNPSSYGSMLWRNASGTSLTAMQEGFTIEMFGKYNLDNWVGNGNGEANAFAFRNSKEANKEAGARGVSIGIFEDKTTGKPMYTATITNTRCNTTGKFVSGTYEQFVLVWDKAATKIYLYVNGKKEGEMDCTVEKMTGALEVAGKAKSVSFRDLGWASATYPWVIGAHMNNSGGAPASCWNGTIANCRVYSETLTAEQIAKSYAALNTPLAE
ncbi:MAG: PL29 family lyase N-terminal domain-containing protein [Bacteroidales bacterium]|nr:PL29 family lyase N-terminal domain-containing protein [Bacteroidales bacterium]